MADDWRSTAEVVGRCRSTARSVCLVFGFAFPVWPLEGFSFGVDEAPRSGQRVLTVHMCMADIVTRVGAGMVDASDSILLRSDGIALFSVGPLRSDWFGAVCVWSSMICRVWSV